jgi:HK97 family phage portal protein
MKGHDMRKPKLPFKFKGATATAETLTLNQLIDFLGLHNVSGEALSEATYFACNKVLSEAIGKLPLKIQQYTPDKGIRIAREHPFYRTLNKRPNPFMTASTFWALMELCRNHHGNAYAQIDTSDPKQPKLWPINPEKVRVWYDNALAFDKIPDVYYQVTDNSGMRVLSSEEVLHFKSHLTVDGLVGISVREQLLDTIQGNVKAQKLVNRLYDSGMTAKAILHYTGSLSDANKDEMARVVEEYAKGKGANGVKNIIPLPLGTTLTPLNLKLTDSQFLELKQFSALQIASAFGVKPYQVGDYTKSSYASAEAQQLSFLIDTLLFNVKQYEEEIDYKILTDADDANGYHSKYNTGVMLRADQKTQIETLSAAVSNFLMTPNEARERLDLPSKEGGDKLLGNGASIPVQLTGAQYTNTAREEENDDG